LSGRSWRGGRSGTRGGLLPSEAIGFASCIASYAAPEHPWRAFFNSHPHRDASERSSDCSFTSHDSPELSVL
jgi:hypothetical protein